jgi:poly-gamma-glutamate capsule biosynthesis protein CapA/YwtB (metallophosphatase superfamily)
MIRICIGGDICPRGKIQEAFIDKNATAIFNDLFSDIAEADLSIVNLECPLVSRKTPIHKVGLVLEAGPQCIEGFKAAHWDVLNLANNHSYDHGADGLRETIAAIQAAGLGTVGAGMNIFEAQAPFIKEIKSQKIVIFSMAEHEYSTADEHTPGSNPLDLINFMRAIRKYKPDCIFIVLLHGGNEYYPYPSPEFVRRCRFMIDMGADAVVCSHTHCLLPWEIYTEKPIVYGLGNLIFESDRKEAETWYEGYLANLMIEDQKVRLEAVPYIQSRERIGAHRMEGHERTHFYEDMQKKTAQVKNSAFIENQWVGHCRKQQTRYLTELFGDNRLMGKAGSLMFRAFHSQQGILNALLMVRCEAHQEVLNTIFREKRLED